MAATPPDAPSPRPADPRGFLALALGLCPTVATVLLIELLARTWAKIPNPPAILITLVVFAAFYGGLATGLSSALVSWVYFAYFFSLPAQPFHYSDENLRRVLVWAVATPAMAVMVGVLKMRLLQRESAARHREVALATECAARAEAERQREQLEAAVCARDEFISIASHELKTPLTSLLLQLQLLARPAVEGNGPPPSDPLTHRLMGNAERQVRRLVRLVERLLDISRVSQGRLSLELADGDLHALVRDVVASFTDQIASARCAVALRGEEPLVGRFDAFRMEQVVTNLLGNALKFGAGKPIEVCVARSGALAILTVTDHGVGIAPEDHRRVFQRFERAGSHGSLDGLGLGLYISDQIVKAHGGAIRLQSALGAGATFVVEIPLST